MIEVTIFSILTVLLVGVAILLHLHLQRKEGSRPFIDKSVANTGFAFFFFLVALFFTFIFLIVRAIIEQFQDFIALWIFSAIFCGIVATAGAFTITNALEKDVHSIQKLIRENINSRPQLKEWIPLPFSIVALDAGSIIQGGAQISKLVKSNWFDKFSSVIQLIVCGFVVLYWITSAVAYQGLVVIVGVLLVIFLTSYDIYVVQRSFAAQEYANTFLGTLLLGVLFSFLNWIGIILLINGIRMTISVVRHRKTQELSLNSIYTNLNPFVYFYFLYLFITVFLFPETMVVDSRQFFTISISLIILILGGFISIIFVFIYWVLIGRHISSHRFEFIGKTSLLIFGFLTIELVGLGVPFLIFGVLQYFAVPLNAAFKRWRETPEKSKKAPPRRSKLKAAAVLTEKEAENKSSQVSNQMQEGKAAGVKERGVYSQEGVPLLKSGVKERAIYSQEGVPLRNSEVKKLPQKPLLANAKPVSKSVRTPNVNVPPVKFEISSKKPLLQRLFHPQGKKVNEKLVRNATQKRSPVIVGLIRDYSNDLIHLLPASGSSALADPVKFAVYAEEVKELQLNANGLSKKDAKEESQPRVEYLGNLPDSMQGIKVFVAPFHLEELIKQRQVLSPNVPLVLVSPPADPSSIPDNTIQEFLTKNQPNITLEFTDPSQFDLEIYRYVLLKFNPTLDVFRVAETIAYMNSLKLQALLVPNVDWLFVQDLIVAGKIPAKNLSKNITFILPAKEALPPKEEPKIPASTLPSGGAERAFPNSDTPKMVGVRISYITTMTVFILILMTGIYFLLERIGLAPIINLSGGLPLSSGEIVIVFVLWTGAIIFLSLYLFFKISNIRLRGLK